MSSSGSEEGGAELPRSSPTSLIRIEARGTERARMEPEGPQAEHPSPLDLIFSCTICQATVAHLYAENDQGKGLKRTANSNESVITKLWLAECAHVTCGKHLDGGGAPFHPEGQAPRAPCPLCSAENGDKSPKALFAINGFKKGEYDVQIPDNYFLIPPMQLGGEDAGLQALRFQYLALVRYGTKMHATIKDIVKTSEHENAARIDSLKAIIAKQERSVKYWSDRQKQITHCLKSFPLLGKTLREARRTLIGLNQDVSSIDQAFAQIVGPSSRAPAGTGIIPASTGIDTVPSSDHRGESRLAQASLADLEALNSRPEALAALSEPTRIVQAPQIREASPKRKRVDSASDAVDDERHVRGGKAFQYEESPIAMPRPMRVPKIVSNIHAYTSPSHRGHIDPAGPFSDCDVHAEHTVIAPGFTQDATQNFSASEPAQGFETGGGYRLPAVHDRYPTTEFNDQNGQYNDTGRSVAETSCRNPAGPFSDYDVHAEHTGIAPGFTQDATQNFSASEPAQGFETGGGYRLPAVHDRYPTMESNDQNGQYNDTGRSVAETSCRNPDKKELGHENFHIPGPRFEQRVPSTAALNQSYLGQHSSFEQRPSTTTLNPSYLGQHSSSEQTAQSTKEFLLPYLGETAPSTATLNRSYLGQQSSSKRRASNTAILNRSNVPQQSSSKQKAPSTKGVLRSYLSEQSSVEQRDPVTATLKQSHFEDRRTTTATASRSPFRAPTIQNPPSHLYPTGYTTNPHATPPSKTHSLPANSLSQRHTTTSHGTLTTNYVSPDRRLTLPPNTSHLTRSTPTPQRSHRGLATNARTSTAQMPTPATSHRAPLDPQPSVASPVSRGGAMTTNQQFWNGGSFASDPSVGGDGAEYPMGERRSVHR